MKLVIRRRTSMVGRQQMRKGYWNYSLEAIINCIIIIPGSLLMFICLCYNCNGLCGGLPSSMLTAFGGKPICRCGVLTLSVLSLPLGLTRVLWMTCFPVHRALEMPVTHGITLLSEQGC